VLPEDSVLVGVINRRRDLVYARDQHWYRIPEKRMPRGITAEYIAFFTSRNFGERNGAVHYFAQVKGFELARRRDLLPNEAENVRADEAYYRIALGDFQYKEPPVVNNTKRSITFIYTTWDRFVHARTIADLYSDGDYFVDRLFYALHDHGLNVTRSWDAERNVDDFAPGLRIMDDKGRTFIASAQRRAGAHYLDPTDGEDSILKAILERINNTPGPATLSIPIGD
jgi:hypothetical protein